MEWDVKKQIMGSISGVDMHPMVEQLLLQREITTPDAVEAFLHPHYETHTHDPYLFVEMPKVVTRIGTARSNNEIVGIFGDHDVDGVSGATVLADGLEALGINIRVYIPDKHSEGHGINIKAVDEFQDAGVTLMISVDCGMSNVDEVAYARKKGIETIIIDHHLVPKIIPDAVAVINPQMPESGYPFKYLCGTGCAFKVVQALYHEFLPEDVDQLKWMLDIVSVGTVADCMPLLGENRTLVKYGLLVLAKTRRIGYQQMIAVGRMPIDENRLPTSTTIAFHIAPRINAAGRMAHARDAYELLREKDADRAYERAQDIEDKNIARRKITERITKEVTAIVARDFADAHFIFVADEDYPVGIVGIIAGRIADTFGKPTGIFHIDGDEARGSFRTPKHVNIVDVLNESSDHLEKFGGHAAAAGATVKVENIENFVRTANTSIQKMLGAVPPEKKVMADLLVRAKDIDIDLLHDLRKFEPFGQENPEPLFHITGLVVSDVRAIGKNNKHLKLKVETPDAPKMFDVIGFSKGEDAKLLPPGTAIELMAHIQENEWMGNVSIQFNMTAWRHAT